MKTTVSSTFSKTFGPTPQACSPREEGSSGVYRRMAALVVALVVVTALVMVLQFRRFGSNPLASRDQVTTKMAGAAVGEPVWVGLEVFPVESNEPVRLRSATLLGVPDGMQVEGIWAVSTRELGHGLIGARGDDLHCQYPNLRLHRVSDAVLQPGTEQDWFLLAKIKATGLGEFRTRGFRVSWEVGSRRGSQTYEDVVGLEVPGKSGEDHRQPATVSNCTSDRS